MNYTAESVDTMPIGYHNGSTKNPANDSNGRPRKPDIQERPVIVWDMEGMNLSGDNKPQHPVLFGNSRETDAPLINQRLGSMEMLQYMIDTAQRYPDALHVGYGFKYDANMLLQDFSVSAIRSLWERNRVKFRHGDWFWTVSYIPGKRFTVTRNDTPKPARKSRHHKGRTSVTIHDFSSFFGGSTFLATAENILKADLSAEDKETIRYGKEQRGNNLWDQLAEVKHYWQREIILMQRVFERFRDVMCQAGFALKDWYGPGALANYINSTRKIRPHLAGGQTTSGIMPDAVHEASKVAFSGGRFEAFSIGRVQGPVHSIDINSAYPYALTMIPSLAAEHGEWVHETNPRTIERFGIYRISYRAPRSQLTEFRPMPLFWRDRRGMISYPNHVTGWYMSPEARMVQNMPGVTVHEGWVWQNDESVYPWEFLHDMYQTRQRLGKDNLLSMPFKLGPNSLYGKYAQTVGWNEKDRTPPKSHSLPIAAWVTSYCRAMLWSAIAHAPDKIIAVETDSIFTTAEPSELGVTLGNALGEWSHKTYDEIVYLQSGMYLTNRDGEWSGVRSRGISRVEFPVRDTLTYLQQLQPGTDWQPLIIETKPRFVGMGRALATHGGFKAAHCRWVRDRKEILVGDTGKRRHHQQFCRVCQAGMTPWEAPHRTFVFSPSDGVTLSQPRRLPWEQAYTAEVQEIRDNLKLEMETANV